MCYRSKLEKHKYGTMSRAGIENAMRDRSPRELQTARPLNLHVYEQNTAAIFLGLHTLRQKRRQSQVVCDKTLRPSSMHDSLKHLGTTGANPCSPRVTCIRRYQVKHPNL